MKKALLIADSGGSKTDWCLIDRLGNRNFFTTESYHPHRMTDEWIADRSGFWKDYTVLYDLEVHFFGAGCMKDQNKKLVKAAFSRWNISEVEVHSDLTGAAIALLGENDGVIGILGTGSVAAIIRDRKVEKVLGGYGYLLGDEGSGYAFGKRLLYAYLHDSFSEQLMHLLEAELGSREEILTQVYGPMGKKYISDISKRVSSFSKNDEITKLHEQNIGEFVDQYLKKIPDLHEVSFVGSYAFYQREILQKLLKMKGIRLMKVIERPIEELTEYFTRRTF